MTISFNLAELTIDTWSGSYGFSLGYLIWGKDRSAFFSTYIFWNQVHHLLRIEILGIIFTFGRILPPGGNAALNT